VLKDDIDKQINHWLGTLKAEAEPEAKPPTPAA